MKHLFTWLVLGAATMAAYVACGTSGQQSALTEESRRPRDLKASSCEIWIDKMVAKQDGWDGAFGSVLNAEAYLKVDLAKTGPIRRVVFYGAQRTVKQSGEVVADTGFREVELDSFVGSQDYFVIKFGDLEFHWFDSSSRPGALAHEGAFYVETVDGRRLWTNPVGQSSNHFLFDRNTVKAIRERGDIYVNVSWGGPFGDAKHTDLATMSGTADKNTYLNPQRCR